MNKRIVSQVSKENKRDTMWMTRLFQRFNGEGRKKTYFSLTVMRRMRAAGQDPSSTGRRAKLSTTTLMHFSLSVSLALGEPTLPLCRHVVEKGQGGGQTRLSAIESISKPVV